MKRAAGFKIENSEGAPPTALVDLAKPAYRMGIARIKVGWEGHRLGVKVKADKEKYSVRETVKASIEVKTPNGKAPKNADGPFAAVDEALPHRAPNENTRRAHVRTSVTNAHPESRLRPEQKTAQASINGRAHSR